MLTLSVTRYVLTSLLTVCTAAAALSSQQVLPNNCKSLKRTLSFDDLPTHPSGHGNITTYSHLTFPSFHLINTTAAASSHLISDSDRTCATTSPNTLIASRHANPAQWPRIVLSSSTAAADDLSPFFHFHGLAMQPMNSTPSATAIYITALGIVEHPDGRKEVRTSHTASAGYPAGFHSSLPFNFTKYWPGWGKNVNMVEIYSESFSGEDRHFCVDDLMVEFVKKDEEVNMYPSFEADTLPESVHTLMTIDFDTDDGEPTVLVTNLSEKQSRIFL